MQRCNRTSTAGADMDVTAVANYVPSQMHSRLPSAFCLSLQVPGSPDSAPHAHAGSFAADQLDGDGVYYYRNGDIYSGAFRAGKKHGSGQMYFKVRGLLQGARWAGQGMHAAVSSLFLCCLGMTHAC